jgi:hypothetical protein
MRRGFEAVQDRTVADAELCPARLALEIPDVFLAAVAATADEGVDLIMGDARVEAVGVWAGVPSRRDPFLAERAARVFDLGIRFERCRCWRKARLSGATRGTVIGRPWFEGPWCWFTVALMNDRQGRTALGPQSYEANDNQPREQPAFRPCHLRLTTLRSGDDGLGQGARQGR